jgi:hypothetical protein
VVHKEIGAKHGPIPESPQQRKDAEFSESACSAGLKNKSCGGWMGTANCQAELLPCHCSVVWCLPVVQTPTAPSK